MAIISSSNTCTNTLRCSSSTRRRCHYARHSMACRRSRRRSHACSKASKVVSGKLKALKNLIPSSNKAETVKAEQLFRETADYINLLRNQVVLLQRLIELYGPNDEGKAFSV